MILRITELMLCIDDTWSIWEWIEGKQNEYFIFDVVHIFWNGKMYREFNLMGKSNVEKLKSKLRHPPKNVALIVP